MIKRMMTVNGRASRQHMSTHASRCKFNARLVKRLRTKISFHNSFIFLEIVRKAENCTEGRSSVNCFYSAATRFSNHRVVLYRFGAYFVYVHALVCRGVILPVNYFALKPDKGFLIRPMVRLVILAGNDNSGLPPCTLFFSFPSLFFIYVCLF